MDSYGAGEEQQDRHSFSDLDNLMTLGFSDISLSGFLDPASFLTDQALDPATPTLCRERRKEKSGSSEWQGFRRADNCVLVQDDPHTEASFLSFISLLVDNYIFSRGSFCVIV